MTLLLAQYNAIPRWDAGLTSNRQEGSTRLQAMLNQTDTSVHAVQLLADLVNFKYFRNEHITCLRDRSDEQSRALAMLRTHCDDESLYPQLIALARNRGTGGLLRDLPDTLRNLLNDLNVDNKQMLWRQLSPGAREFLVDAGVSAPHDGAWDHNALTREGYQMASRHGYAAGYGTLLLHVHATPQAVFRDAEAQRNHRIQQQQKTLLCLLRQRPTSVFEIDMHLRDYRASVKYVRNLIRTVFQGYTPRRQLTAQQQDLLSRVGPVAVYAELAPVDVTVQLWRSRLQPTPPPSLTDQLPPPSASSADIDIEQVTHTIRTHMKAVGPQTVAVVHDEGFALHGLIDQPDFYPDVYTIGL